MASYVDRVHYKLLGYFLTVTVYGYRHDFAFSASKTRTLEAIESRRNVYVLRVTYLRSEGALLQGWSIYLVGILVVFSIGFSLLEVHVVPEYTKTSNTSPIIVNPIPGLPGDFIRGVDASEAPWILELGGKYYDEWGNERDLLDILWENGVNWIRLRVWNDPYDEQGNPYGGGNCDLLRMTAFAAKAKVKGFKVLVDFHYSDWWADPGKQNKPKAWANLTFTELVEAVYNWTREAITYMKNSGALPDMVQVGNEINNGFLWPEGRAENWTQFVSLLKSAIRAIRDVDPNIKVVIHLSGHREIDFYVNFISRLIESGVNFDVIGISFYTYWHGTMDKFKNLVRTLTEKFNKEIVVAETAYAWTLEDADGHPNLFGSRDQELRGGYKATVQGQASFIRDIVEALYAESSGKGLGIFYWGATWIPYPGAGWKTGEGNPWENQALFDFNGKALPSIKVFKLLYEAAPQQISPLELYSPEPINVTTYVGVKPQLPSTVLVVYADHSIKRTPVDWGTIPVYDKVGTYTHRGYVVNTAIEVVAKITVLERVYVEVVDVEGDDRGIGTYGYPTAAVYKPGVFDITKTLIEVLGEDVVIRVYFKDLGGNPWNGPNGFSLQYVHVYMRTTNPLVTSKVYRKDTFGLNIELREDYAWQHALLISPGWGTSPLVEGELSALYYANGTVYVEDKDFTVSVNLAENYVEVKIPRSLLPDWENVKYWKILVFATSWAGENPDRIRAFAPGGGEWVVDATRYAEKSELPKIASAVLTGTLPKFFDLAVYSEEYPSGITAKQQYEWAKAFDPATNKLAVVPPLLIPVITQTVTQTLITTQTLTTHATTTIAEKYTVTSTLATTSTEYITQLETTTIVVSTIAGLVGGVLLGFYVGKRTK